MQAVNAAKDQLRKYAKPETRAAIWELVSTVVPFCLAWVIAVNCFATHTVWGWLGGIAVSLANGLLLTRLFVLQHDCGHYSFFPTKRLNNIAGNLLSVFTLTPLYNWRREHNLHHATVGNLDHIEHNDFWMLTQSEFLAAPLHTRIVYRIYRSHLLLFVIGPVLYLTIRRRFPVNLPRTLKRERRNVQWTNLGLLFFYGTLFFLLGPAQLAAMALPTIAVGASTCVIGFFAQHNFEGGYWERSGEWKFQDAALSGSSFFDMPKWMHWVTANIAVHHIHHLESGIPSYKLQACMRENPDIKPGKTLDLKDFLGAARLKLWDEDSKVFTGYPK